MIEADRARRKARAEAKAAGLHRIRAAVVDTLTSYNDTDKRKEPETSSKRTASTERRLFEHS